MSNIEKDFESLQEKLLWQAFSGKCGSEFAGNPHFMELFMEKERERKENLSRSR